MQKKRVFIPLWLLVMSAAFSLAQSPEKILVDLTIPAKFQQVAAGESLLSQSDIVLINEDQERLLVDLFLTYTIRNNRGAELLTLSVTKGAAERLDITQEFIIPESAAPGAYVLEVSVEAPGLRSVESASFEVLSSVHPPAGFLAHPSFFFPLIVLSLGVVLSFIWAFFEHRKIKKLEKELISIHHIKKWIRKRR